MFPVEAICNDIILRANRESIRITPLKLQKLLYLLYGYYAAETDSYLFKDAFEAWEFGPVVRDVYIQFKIFGGANIDRLAVAPNNQKIVPDPSKKENKLYRIVFEKVWNKYKNISANVLVSYTHLKNSPWALTKLRCEINRELIKRYFKGEDISSGQAEQARA